MLSVDAALVAESTGLRLRIDGNGSVVTCRLDGQALTLLDMLRRGRRLLPLLRAVVPLLVRSGLRLDIVAGERRIAQLGTGVKANAVARVLRLPSTNVGA